MVIILYTWFNYFVIKYQMEGFFFVLNSLLVYLFIYFYGIWERRKGETSLLVIVGITD